MKHTITLPVNSTRVKTEEIPWIIAGAIIPAEQASVVKITAILKRDISSETYYDEGLECASTPQEPLTDSDWKYLYKLCGLSGLPPLMNGGELIDIKLSDWGLYEKAFEEYTLKWMLLPCSNTVLKIVADKHRDALKNAILNNEVVVYDNLTYLPVQKPTVLTALKNTYIRLNEFIEFVAKFDLDVVVDKIVENNTLANNAKSNLKKIPVQSQQETAIINWLLDSGYTPTELPVAKNGMSGVKKMCRDVLLTHSLFSSKSIFDTAWQRLRDDSKIIDA